MKHHFLFNLQDVSSEENTFGSMEFYTFFCQLIFDKDNENNYKYEYKWYNKIFNWNWIE